MSRHPFEPEWTELRISDSPIDAPEDAEPGTTRWLRLPTASATASDDDVSGGTLPRAGVKLRWCAAALIVAATAAAAAVGFAQHRGGTITTVRQVAAAPTGLDASGCPRGDTCSALDGLYGGLPQAMNVDLPSNEVLFASEMINNTSPSSARRLRLVRLDQSGVRIFAVNACGPSGLSVTPWTQNLGGVGPTLAVLLKPTQAGCNLALLADVPAGVPVPVSELRRLAADHNTDGG